MCYSKNKSKRHWKKKRKFKETFYSNKEKKNLNRIWSSCTRKNLNLKRRRWKN